VNLRKYQETGIQFLKRRRFALLADDMGLGKTAQAVNAIEDGRNILIICPASVKYHWQKQLVMWRGFKSTVINSSKEIITKNKEASIYIINYDLIIKDPIFKQLMDFRWAYIICDEAHRLKNTQAKRTKKVLSKKGLRIRTDRMWFLTGTPIKNRPIDLYPMLASCAPETIHPHTPYVKFAFRYCGAFLGAFGLDVSGASHERELNEKLKGFMLRRDKREVLTELPDRILNLIEIDCTNTVRAKIKEIEDETVEKAGDDDPSNFQLGEIARLRHAMAEYKIDDAADFVRDTLEEVDKIVVFYHHKKVAAELKNKLHNIQSVCVDGSCSSVMKQGMVNIFQERKEVKIFFGQIQAAGEGIDGLQDVCSTCLFVEPSWSPTDIEQCIGRLERLGQRNVINVNIMIIKDTIEERMMETMVWKEEVHKKIITQEHKESTMYLEERIEALEKRIEALENNAVEAGDPIIEKPVKASRTKEVKKEVKKEEKVEITIDMLKDRASDVCEAKPGVGMELCRAAIARCGGPRLASLKGNQKAMANCMDLFNKILDEDYDPRDNADAEKEDL